MNEVLSITQLNTIEIGALLNELKKIDPKVEQKLQFVKQKTGRPSNEALEFIVCDSPILWAKVYLNWEARDYQELILEKAKTVRSLVLRLGRRLGKTDSMCVLILWFAYTQANKGPNNQYDILIITPYETQIDLIYKRLQQLIDGSPMLRQMIKRSIHHLYELENGSTIKGLTAGAKSGNEANNTRGQRADVIVLDECDYIGSAPLTNVINIRNEEPERIKVIAASTPSGKHEEYYKWCTGASHRYAPSSEDIKNFEFNGYQYVNNPKGNGWTEIYAPSIVNKGLLKVNPETGVTYIEDLRQELSEMRFVQEVLAEFGEEEMGLYKDKYVLSALQEGARIDHKYTTDMTQAELMTFLKKNPPTIKLLGVDWDKVQAGSTLVGVEFDHMNRNINGQIEPKFKVMFRLEIPRSEFTYTNAVNKIIELNETYQFDWIAIDRGYGKKLPA